MRDLLGLMTGEGILWLLLSGHYTPLTLSLGAVSCLFAAVLWRRLRTDAVPLPTAGRLLRLPGYMLWLLGQIARANLAVSRRILSPAALSPQLVTLDAAGLTPLGESLYAQSITLTPGTVAIGLSEHRLIVHALTDADARALTADGGMKRRVRRLTDGPD